MNQLCNLMLMTLWTYDSMDSWPLDLSIYLSIHPSIYDINTWLSLTRRIVINNLAKLSACLHIPRSQMTCKNCLLHLFLEGKRWKIHVWFLLWRLIGKAGVHREKLLYHQLCSHGNEVNKCETSGSTELQRVSWKKNEIWQPSETLMHSQSRRNFQSLNAMFIDDRKIFAETIMNYAVKYKMDRID